MVSVDGKRKEDFHYLLIRGSCDEKEARLGQYACSNIEIRTLITELCREENRVGVVATLKNSLIAGVVSGNIDRNLLVLSGMCWLPLGDEEGRDGLLSELIDSLALLAREDGCDELVCVFENKNETCRTLLIENGFRHKIDNPKTLTEIWGKDIDDD